MINLFRVPRPAGGALPGEETGVGCGARPQPVIARKGKKTIPLGDEPLAMAVPSSSAIDVVLNQRLCSGPASRSIGKPMSLRPMLTCKKEWPLAMRGGTL